MSTAFTPFSRGGSGPPMLCLHGFTDTWRTWDLVLPALERRHEVLAPTLPGHAGGPPLVSGAGADAVVDELERTMDEAGFATAHIVGNSLGGYLALKLAARGRARTVIALAPAGGWAPDDDSWQGTLEYFEQTRQALERIAPQAEQVLSRVEGRRAATREFAERFEHIPVDLLAHMMRGVAACEAMGAMIAQARAEGWHVDAARIDCPVRMIWGTADRVLAWPSAAARYRREWLPHADWVEIEGAGHCPQLDVPLETAQLVLGFTAG